MVADPSAATQADIAKAYLDLYDAWESCAANAAAIRVMLQEQERVTEP